jgi:mannose-1-phosphate guanylyltransferase
VTLAGPLPADPTPAAIILAGGEGSRLRTLTRRLSGDDRPKQFCRLLGDETLLEQTRRRLGRLVPADRVVFSVTRSHQPYWSHALGDVAPEALVVQPEGRGTAPAILYALLRVQAQAGPGPAIILPSDHHVADDDAFMARVDGAVEACLAGSDLVVLIGIAPDRPEASYGWIEPGDLVLGPWPHPLYRVRRFWEKPEAAVARALERRGCLWNAFVIVARPAALLRLMAGAAPRLVQAFEPVRARLGTRWEERAARDVYRALPPADFSRDVLERRPGTLTVLPVSGVGWTDLGEPARVAEARQRIVSAVPA